MRCILSVCPALDIPSHSLQLTVNVDMTLSTWPGAGKKKENEDGMTVVKAEDFGRWYQELVVKSKMIEYSSYLRCDKDIITKKLHLIRQSGSSCC